MRIAIAIIICFISSTPLKAQHQKIKLAADIWPPFTNVKGERSVSLDIVGIALRRIGVNHEVKVVTVRQLAEGLYNGSFDGSASVWKNAIREDRLVFSIPYMQNQLILVGKKNADVSAKAFSNLNDVTIGIISEYAYGKDITNHEQINWKEASNQQENLKQLLKGEVDYILVDALMIEYVLKHQSLEAEQFLNIGEHTLLSKPLHFALNKEVENAEKIISLFNAEIIKMIEDGTYNRILNLDRVYADIDQDGIGEHFLLGDNHGPDEPRSSYNLHSSINKVESPISYVIEGKKYQNWSEVPEKHKNPVRDEQIQGFTVLRFDF